MSHYTVVVIGETTDTLEAALEPFNEQPEMGAPYLHFTDKEAEIQEEYATRQLKMRELKNGRYVSLYDPDYEGQGPEVEVAANRAYKTWQEFAEEWHGLTKDDLTGKYGYYSNPNARWDWWVVGGRWSGFFKVKPNAEGMLGSPGVFDNVPRDGYVDVITKGDWDLAGQRDDFAIDAGAAYDEFYAVLGDFEFPPNWMEFKSSFENIDDAREAYRNLPVMKHIRANDPEHKYTFVDDLAGTFGCSKEEYMQRARQRVGQPFAILYKRTWYERGSMGWWGMVSNEKDALEWQQQVAELFDSLSDDTPLILVDCHI